ncbi:HNH endonuclease [Bacillus suaedae]|uniref:HNH endonuclease n=1 Tax=Halalkalibacter suaedae TaxID=2822140 RepID=A0A941AMR2_9BACI|nr:HNH endonuclease [Bacillus suaedae]MBP3949497.1 HNH endonuclease [Bacillus suaedae]
MKKRVGQCELCERQDVELTIHHLTPKEEGGTFLPTVQLCIPCHKQIHALYTNKEICERLTSIERLRDDEELKRFIKWIRKQPSTSLIRIKKSNERKRKSKR